MIRQNTSTSTWRKKSRGHGRGSEAKVWRGHEGDCHTLFEKLREEGKEVVLLESGGGAVSDGAVSGGASRVVSAGWSFVCVVNKKVRVPEGEAGLVFMREFIGKNGKGAGLNSTGFSSGMSGLPEGKTLASFTPKAIKATARLGAEAAVPFTAGFVGFVSYDLGEKWMGVGVSMESPLVARPGGDAFMPPRVASIRPGIPLAYFIYTDEVYAFKNKSHVVRGRATSAHAENASVNGNASLLTHTPPQATLSRDEYFKNLAVIRTHLFAGDTYQINFSQRFEAPFSGDAFEVYKKITAINPSPFQFFMEMPRFAVISNSPEKLFSLNMVGVVETQPIKGTVPRGATAKDDACAVKALLASGKERSELAMIVDLARNDLGKICVPGSVKVAAKRAVQKYSHVIHTVATIRGKLEKKYDWYDALRALFPGGSVTGCPKKRSMEIINALEDEARGVYCGSAGYIDLSGSCNFNIMIRTLWLEKRGKSGTLTFRSGGGIVVESDPVSEYKETLHKAGAIIKALI